MDFATWMKEQGYAESTIRVTLNQTRVAARAFYDGQDITPYTAQLRRVATWASAHAPDEAPDFIRVVADRFPAVAQTDKPSRGLIRYVRTPLTAEQWAALLEYVQKKMHRPKWQALWIVLQFPSPACDVTRILARPVASLTHAAPPLLLAVLKRVQQKGSKTLTEHIGAPSTRAAYDAMRTKLVTAGKKIGVTRLTFGDVDATPWSIRK